jgi:hypothetical protein
MHSWYRCVHTIDKVVVDRYYALPQYCSLRCSHQFKCNYQSRHQQRKSGRWLSSAVHGTNTASRWSPFAPLTIAAAVPHMRADQANKGCGQSTVAAWGDIVCCCCEQVGPSCLVQQEVGRASSCLCWLSNVVSTSSAALCVCCRRICCSAGPNYSVQCTVYSVLRAWSLPSQAAIVHG